MSPRSRLPAIENAERACIGTVTRSALLTFAASASAFLLDTPDVWYADERATERWQWQGGLPDPAQFDLLLVNNNSNWDLANNVRTVDEEVSFKVPDVPAG